MKNCVAGHELVLYSSNRCPVCAAIDRLDKELLEADARIAELEEKIAAHEAPDEEFREWNGGHA